MPSLRLRSKILIAFVIVLLPMLALIVIDDVSRYQERADGILGGQARTGEAIGALFEASIDDALAVAWSFSKDPVVRTMDPRQIDPYLASLEPVLPQYENLVVLDAAGNNVGIMAPRLPPGEPRAGGASRAYFEAVKSTLQPAVSEVVIGRVSGKPTVAIAVPMLDDSGAFFGAIVVALDLDYLAQRVATVGLLPSQAIFLTDQQGMLAFHTLVASDQWGRSSFADFPPVRSALQGAPARDSEIRSEVGDVRMVTTALTPEHGWVVGASIPRAEVLQPVLDELARRLLVFVGVLALASVIALAMTQRVIVRPLELLAAHLRSFGQGGARGRIELRTGDEMELVARSFNVMADQLERAAREKDAALADVRRRAKELDALIQSMAEGVTIISSEGRLLRLNRAGREILGLPTDESIAISLDQFDERDVLRRDCFPMARDEWPINRVLRGEAFSEQELLYRRPDGTWVSLLYAGSGVQDDEGRLVVGVNVFRDITAIRDLERQREEFISVVAHDLRNAIAVVGGYAAILENMPPEKHWTPHEGHAVESLRSGVRRLERMVADLLDVSRIEARRLTLATKPIDLATVVPEIVRRSGELTAGHAVRVDVPAKMVQVEADPDRIEQVLGNMLSNAGKYSYPDTEITVGVEVQLNEALVSVGNLGAGIPPEERERLFTRWHRARAVGNGSVAGLGLGLYIAKGLVEAHGGRIWVESEPGKYANFRFALPLSAA